MINQWLNLSKCAQNVAHTLLHTAVNNRATGANSFRECKHTATFMSAYIATHEHNCGVSFLALERKCLTARLEKFIQNDRISFSRKKEGWFMFSLKFFKRRTWQSSESLKL